MQIQDHVSRAELIPPLAVGSERREERGENPCNPRTNLLYGRIPVLQPQIILSGLWRESITIRSGELFIVHPI